VLTDCPLLAQQLEHVRAQLSANAQLDIVAVAADPYHEKLSDLRNFIATRGLTNVKNFYYVTGKLSERSKGLEQVRHRRVNDAHGQDEHSLGLHVHHQRQGIAALDHPR